MGAASNPLRPSKTTLHQSLVLSVVVIVVVVVVVISAMIMVVIIPVAVSMPTMCVLIPPLVCVRPAIFARFVQLLAGIDGLSALPAIMFGGFVQPVVGLSNAPLA
jgi:hypothetical protein